MYPEAEYVGSPQIKGGSETLKLDLHTFAGEISMPDSVETPDASTSTDRRVYMGTITPDLAEHALAVWGVLEHLSPLVPNLGFWAEQPQAECVRTCAPQECHAYVGFFGTQYGAPLSELNISQLELEWGQAREAGMEWTPFLRQPVNP